MECYLMNPGECIVDLNKWDFVHRKLVHDYKMVCIILPKADCTVVQNTGHLGSEQM